VQRGENLYRIATRYGTTVQAIMNANGLRNANLIYVGQRLTIPTSSAGGSSGSASRGVHVVKRGETLSSIARRYGTTVQAIMNNNGLRNANLIYVGQRLTLPGSDGSTRGGGGTAPSGWLEPL